MRIKHILSTTLVLASVVLAAGLLRLLTAQGTSSDYLSPELRKRVDQLKRDAATQPTSPDNVVNRGLILYDWVNAYSLTGGTVPVNATQELAPVIALQDGTPAAINLRPTLIKNIDNLIYEFRIKDEHPKWFPVVQASTSGPFPASSFQTFEQTVTVGELPMRPGGILMLARTLMNDGGPPQVADPKAANYVTLKCSNPEARFVKATVEWTGMHGGFRGEAANAAFRLEGASLKPGDVVTLTYGDRQGGSPGLKMPSFSNDKLLYPIYVDVEANGRFLSPAWPPLSVIGNQVAYVRATAPSVVAIGEPFTLAVRSEDGRWNRATGNKPAYDLLLNGKVVRAIPAGQDGLVQVNGLRIDEPGTYRFQVRSADGRLNALSNPIWVEQNPAQRVYWGETHAHSGFSEGMGSVDAFYKWGRDDAALDFAGLSEHDVWLDDSEWKAMDEAVRRYTEPGKFIAFLAYEWTVQRPLGGHHNVFFRTPGRTRVPAQIAYRLSLLYQGLREKAAPKDVLVIPHAHQAADWRRTDPDLERVVEIASMHGTFEWFGNYYLKNGAEIGFVGASDDHRTRPGYSGAMPAGSLQQMNALVAVRAKDKTVNSIFDGLRDRATYATSDAERILVDFRLNDQFPGRRIPYSPNRRIVAHVSGTGPLDKVEIIKNGEVIYAQRFAKAELQPRSRVDVGLYSSSETFIRDNPRGYRRWKGSLDVEGAQLLDIADSFDNRAAEFARRDPQNPNRILFLDDTRGKADKLTLDLDQVTPSTRLVFHLDPSQEHDVAPPQVRPYASIPGATVVFPFNEMNEGLLTRDLPVERFADKIFIQFVSPQSPMDGQFEYIDRSAPLPGDYYYLRVTQINGAHAWSSPIWVGGESPR